MVVDVGTTDVSMASAGQSQFAMNPTATSLLNAIQRVANSGPDALKQLGSEIKVRARLAAPHI